MPIAMQNTWMIQDGSINNTNIEPGVYLFIEYGKVGSDPEASRQVNLIDVGTTTYDMTQSLLLSDGTYELVFEDEDIARSSLISDMKSFPIDSMVSQHLSEEYAAMAVAIGGTP